MDSTDWERKYVVERPGVECSTYLRNPRIHVRRPHAEDAAAIFEKWAGNPDDTYYMGWPTHQTLDDTYAFLAFSDEHWHRWGSGPLLVEHIPTGRVIGSSGLMVDQVGDDGLPETAEGGYIIARGHRGCGYATEALRATIEAARALGVKRLCMGIHPRNIASRKVAHRGGLVLAEIPFSEGVFPQIDPQHPLVTVNYGIEL